MLPLTSASGRAVGSKGAPLSLSVSAMWRPPASLEAVMFSVMRPLVPSG